MESSKSLKKAAEDEKNEEEIALGYCRDHARGNEAFCEPCRIMICPTCVMFGTHSGHKVMDPAKAVGVIREKVEKTKNNGKLNHEHTERFLLDVRDAKIKVNKSQTAVKEQVTGCFKKIINTLKRRKEQVEDEVFQHFTRENEIVDQEEQNWEEKARLGKILLEYSNSPDDEALMKNSLQILNAIDVLNEPNSVKGVDMINSVDLTTQIGEKEVGFAKLVRLFEKIGSFGEMKKIQFRS